MATNKKHKWSFENLGGSTRVKITSGADIAHLDELDPKMWTVLACPTTGLEIDEKSLKYLDNDGDGRRGWIEYASGIGEDKNTELFTYLELIDK